MSTTTNLSSLVINYLTQSQYDAASQAGTLNENQIYLTPAVELATVATSGSYNDLSNKPTIPNVPSWALQSSKPSYSLSEISGTDDLQSIEGLSGTSGLLKKTAANTWTLDTNTYLTSYTETDPVFSASAAAGITSTDISNWNAKVSDDKTWNGVALNKSATVTQTTPIYIPYLAQTSSSSADLLSVVANTTGASAANKVPKYNNSGYLVSTTPSANDNSTKVATTAYVDNAVGGITVPTKVSDLTNDSGFITSYTDEKLAVTDISVSSATRYYPIFGTDASAATRQYDTQGLRYQVSTDYSELLIGYSSPNKKGEITLFNNGYYKSLQPTTLTSSGIINLPDANGTIALTSDIPSVYNSSTNPNGYLTMSTLPIYDGMVV